MDCYMELVATYILEIQSRQYQELGICNYV
jgi:hypothetical protein